MTVTLRKAKKDELGALVAIDDAASELYSNAGLHIEFGHDHPFVVAEAVRWSCAIEHGLADVAVGPRDEPIGFIILGTVDGEPYLDQLSVHPDAMRQGIGSALLNAAIRWAGNRPLWLTTYSHLPWNKPYYERSGFSDVAEHLIGPELGGIIQHQRSVLPDPQCRIAMVLRPGVVELSGQV